MGELLLLIGTSYNLLLVAICCRLLDERFSVWRAICCSFASALCSVVIENALLCILVSFILLLAAFTSKKRLLLKGLYLLTATFLLGGMLTAVESYATTTIQFYALLLIASLLFLLFITAILQKAHMQLLVKRYCIHCVVQIEGKAVATTGFLDTGNQSIEPLTGRPVHFATLELLMSMPQLRQSIQSWSNTKPNDFSMFHASFHKRLRPIFVDTVVGKELVLAIRCTVLINEHALEEQYVVFVQQPLQFRPDVQLVLNAAVLQYVKK